MAKKRRKKTLKPIQGEDLKWLLKKQPALRRTLKKLRLKLTTRGRVLGTPKSGCEPPGWTGGRLPADPLIVKRK